MWPYLEIGLAFVIKVIDIFAWRPCEDVEQKGGRGPGEEGRIDRGNTSISQEAPIIVRSHQSQANGITYRQSRKIKIRKRYHLILARLALKAKEDKATLKNRQHQLLERTYSSWSFHLLLVKTENGTTVLHVTLGTDMASVSI
jgi:hypothetical protein